VNRVVARFADGRMVDGTTVDFSPEKDVFHVSAAAAPARAKPVAIHTKDLKALFFVKDFAGDPQHTEWKMFHPAQPRTGCRLRVAFKDGEVLVGTTTSYQPGRKGFFLVLADASSNIKHCYIVTAATQEISLL